MSRHIAVAMSCALAALLFSSAAPAQQDELNRAQNTSRDTTREAKASQDKINRLSDQARDLLEKYRAQLWQAQQLQLYVRQLDSTVTQQDQRIAALQEQLERLERTREELVPMMVRMVDGLESFIKLDLPFLPEERNERVERLRSTLSDSELPVSEKYRRVFEAYQVEAGYGRTLEAWRGALPGQAQIVDFLRIGRMAWYYLSLDGLAAWQWNRGQQRWDEVPNSQVSAIRKGLRVASEQAAPELLALPVGNAKRGDAK